MKGKSSSTPLFCSAVRPQLRETKLKNNSWQWRMDRIQVKQRGRQLKNPSNLYHFGTDFVGAANCEQQQKRVFRRGGLTEPARRSYAAHTLWLSVRPFVRRDRRLSTEFYGGGGTKTASRCCCCGSRLQILEQHTGHHYGPTPTTVYLPSIRS